jgi:hypothetical protein
MPLPPLTTSPALPCDSDVVERRLSQDIRESDGHTDEGYRAAYGKTIEVLLHHPAAAQRAPTATEHARETRVFPRVKKDKHEDCYTQYYVQHNQKVLQFTLPLLRLASFPVDSIAIFYPLRHG